MQKIRTEMEKNLNNPYIQPIGQFLLTHLEQNPQDVEKINNPDKTIKKSLDEVRKVAEKKKVGNCAVLADQEVFEIVLKYFGITGGAKNSAAPLPNNPAAPSPHNPAEQLPPKPVVGKVASKIDFDIKLDELL